MGKQWFETASTSSGSRVVGRCGCAHFAYVDHSFYHEGPLDSNPFEWSQMGMVLLCFIVCLLEWDSAVHFCGFH